MAKFDIQNLLTLAADRMTTDLNHELTSHPGERGSSREEIIRSFLRKHLAKRFDVSSGFVFDCHGSVSKQMDVVISDPTICPHFEVSGGVKYFPCETVVAVGQIKSSITSEKILREAFDNIESAKLLDRSSMGKAYDRRYDEFLDPTDNHLHQIFGFVLIVGRSISPETIQGRLLEYILEREPHRWTNLLLTLDRYLVTYCCDYGVCPNPLDARGISIQRSSDNPDLILRFLLLLGRAIEVTRVSAFPYWEYLNIASDWSAKTIYAAVDDPPPYLSSLASFKWPKP